MQKIRLTDEQDDGLVLDATPAERMAMVWPMTLDCWAMTPGFDGQLQFQRHVASVQRRGG
ncbi:MAG: hypothetical protein NXI22_07170 [bacterium]|nr:hypothetical protein [bacterium]